MRKNNNKKKEGGQGLLPPDEVGRLAISVTEEDLEARKLAGANATEVAARSIDDHLGQLGVPPSTDRSGRLSRPTARLVREFRKNDPERAGARTRNRDPTPPSFLDLGVGYFSTIGWGQRPW
jgi:hypothetical protein